MPDRLSRAHRLLLHERSQVEVKCKVKFLQEERATDADKVQAHKEPELKAGAVIELIFRDVQARSVFLAFLADSLSRLQQTGS